MHRLCVVAFLIAAAGCEDRRAALAEDPYSGPDVGDVEHFQACMAKPRRTLSKAEQCQLALLRQQCTPVADCLVTCISAPEGNLVGGGCAHVCTRVPIGDEELPGGFHECGGIEAVPNAGNG